MVSSIRRSFAWTYAGQLVGFMVMFVGSVIVARILSPVETGIFAIAAALLGIIQVLTSFDVSSYVIREHELTQERLDSAFTVNAALAFFLAVVIFSASFAATPLLGDPRVGPVLQVLAIAPALGPLSFYSATMLQREMSFRSLSFIKLSGVIATTGITVVAAVSGRSYMSPAYGYVAGSMTMGAGYIIAARHHFRLNFCVVHWREVTRFGLAMTTISGLSSLVSRLCELMLGRALGLAPLGLFSRASSVSGMILDNLYLAGTRVLFPKLAQDQREGRGLANTYLRSQQILTALMWPFLAGLAILSGPVMLVFYGPKWLGAAPLLSLLLVGQIISTSFGMAWELFVLRGETVRLTKLEATRGALALSCFVVGLHFGLFGAASSRIVEGLISFCIYFPSVVRLAGVQTRPLLFVYLQSGALTIAASFPTLVLMATWNWDPHQSLINVGATVIAGAALWLSVLVAMRHPLLEELKNLLRKVSLG